MRRREFITALGGAAAWPLAARAQQSAMPVIGFLAPGTADTTRVAVESVHRGLSDSGFVEGRNLTVEYRWGDNSYGHLTALADDLVRRKVSVIVAINTGSAFVAKSATASIPIVFATGINPVEAGLVGSLNRPGGNLTGITILLAEVAAKRLELLHELVPAATIAFLVSPINTAFAESETNALQMAARALGVNLLVLNTSGPDEFDAAFVRLVGAKAGGLVVGGDILFVSYSNEILALAARHRVPTIFPQREFVTAGGLMSYGTDLSSAYQQVGIYAGRILKGENPADLPVQQSTRVQLLLNLKTARTLGVRFPLTLLGRADEVIE